MKINVFFVCARFKDDTQHYLHLMQGKNSPLITSFTRTLHFSIFFAFMCFFLSLIFYIINTMSECVCVRTICITEYIKICWCVWHKPWWSGGGTIKMDGNPLQLTWLGNSQFHRCMALVSFRSIFLFFAPVVIVVVI